MQKGNHATSKASVEGLEKEQKIIWKMIGKVDCYLQALIKSTETMPTQAAITACQAIDPDTDALNITYTDPDEEDKCMDNAALGTDLASATYRPGVGSGSTSWYYKEMEVNGLTAHDKLNSDVACHTPR